MENMSITIFTPTFNRDELLKKLYHSLVKQSDNRYDWLIVDDGSVDKTAQYVHSWKNEGKVAIQYIYQKNQGKHVAHNTGVKNTNSKYFYTVDSDDELPEDAIASIYEAISDISARHDIAGIIAKRGFHNGEDQCSAFPDNISEVSIRDLYKVHKLKGELALVFKTEVMKEFLFPVFTNEKFVTESVILDLISMKYKMIILNKVIYMGEYLPDGYTRNLNRIHKNNPGGYYHYLTQEIKLARNSHELRHAYANYISGCWKIGYKVKLNFKCFFANLPGAIELYLKQILKEKMVKSKIFRPFLKQVCRVKFI